MCGSSAWTMVLVATVGGSYESCGVKPETIRKLGVRREEREDGRCLRHHLGGPDAGQRSGAGGLHLASFRRGGGHVVDRIALDAPNGLNDLRVRIRQDPLSIG